MKVTAILTANPNYWERTIEYRDHVKTKLGWEILNQLVDLQMEYLKKIWLRDYHGKIDIVVLKNTEDKMAKDAECCALADVDVDWEEAETMESLVDMACDEAGRLAMNNLGVLISWSNPGGREGVFKE